MMAKLMKMVEDRVEKFKRLMEMVEGEMKDMIHG